MSKDFSASLITAIILGVAISLPIILFKITESMSRVSGQWDGSGVITVFVPQAEVKSNSAVVDEQFFLDIGHRILQIPRVRDVEFISPQQVLDDFKRTSQLGNLLDDLKENPLPGMLVVFPEDDLNDEDMTELVNILAEMENVDSVAYDQQWRQRLRAIIQVFEYAAMILATLMGTGVVLIINNTVRLGILRRQKEIQIIDQIGGTASFIRRPFLYLGTMQGISGAMVALGISASALMLLGSPVNALATLYNSEFRIHSLDIMSGGRVVFLSAMLGWVAARLTVGSYIRKMRASALGK